MKFTKIETVTIEKEITTDIICNNCGNSCKTSYDKMESYEGLLEITVQGSYWTKKLSDCANYTFSLCENCLSEMFKNFKVPVEITGYNP